MLLRKLVGHKRAISKAAGRDGERPLQEWRKLLSIALARYTAATVLSATGHKALRGTYCAPAVLPSCVPFGTELLFLNTESKTETEMAKHPFHIFCCKFGEEPGSDRTEQSCARCTGSGSNLEDMELHVPDIYDWVMAKREGAPLMQCAVVDVVCWFPEVLQKLWMDVSAQCPHAERYNESASKPGVQLRERWRERIYTVRPFDPWSSRRMEDWAAKAPIGCGTW